MTLQRAPPRMQTASGERVLSIAKDFAPRPPVKKKNEKESGTVEAFNMALLRAQSTTPPNGPEAYGMRCVNCDRPLLVGGGAGACREGGRTYCGKNCMWSAACDPSGMRFRVAARRERNAKPRKKRRRKDLVDIPDTELDPSKEKELADWSHVMFAWHEKLFEMDCEEGRGGRGEKMKGSGGGGQKNQEGSGDDAGAFDALAHGARTSGSAGCVAVAPGAPDSGASS